LVSLCKEDCCVLSLCKYNELCRLSEDIFLIE
jgi:hypothetical protein